MNWEWMAFTSRRSNDIVQYHQLFSVWVKNLIPSVEWYNIAVEKAQRGEVKVSLRLTPVVSKLYSPSSAQPISQSCFVHLHMWAMVLWQNCKSVRVYKYMHIISRSTRTWSSPHIVIHPTFCCMACHQTSTSLKILITKRRVHLYAATAHGKWGHTASRKYQWRTTPLLYLDHRTRWVDHVCGVSDCEYGRKRNGILQLDENRESDYFGVSTS